MSKTHKANIKRKKSGFTLTELLIGVSIIVVLMAIVILVINPSERLAKARDNQREEHLDIIWNAIEQKIYQNEGEWDCGDLEEDPQIIGSGEGEYDLFSCLYPDFIPDPNLLIDPQAGSFISLGEYYTAYQIWQKPETETISLCVEPDGQGETRLVYVGDSPVLLTQGEECNYDSDCESGYCIDGVCCDGSCAGDCEACNLTGTEGTCTVREANDNSEVATTCYYCNGTSTTAVAYTGDEGISCTGDCTHCDSGSCVNWPNDTQQEGCTGFCQVCQSGACTVITSVTFTYKGGGVTYGTVESLGECWMDRNLGASRVATAYNDSEAYGDLFQWGRCDDGHQTITSPTYSGPVSSYECEGGNDWDGDFITVSAQPYDWLTTQNDNLWQGDGSINDPCPSGWRVPTLDEWVTEASQWTAEDRDGAFESILKLPSAGHRRRDGALEPASVGLHILCWASGTTTTNAQYAIWREPGESHHYGSNNRAFGYTVRCIKD